MNLREHDGSVTFDVLVQPRASRAKLGPVHDGRLKVAVTSPPVDGEANAAVIELLAKSLGVSKSAVEVIAGQTSRRKTVRVAGVARAAILALVAMTACAGKNATLDITLATAPGTNLDAVQTLHVKLTSPAKDYTIQRTSSGFDLDLDLDATGDQSALIVDGLDGSGATIVAGRSPNFPLGPLEGHIAIYLGPPNGIAASPAAFDPPRSDIGVGTLGYGALFAGGSLADGAPSDAVSIYNAYDHSLVAGLALPMPRSAPVVGVGAHGIVYIFGGTNGATASNLWRFDTTQAPAGAYNDFGEKEGFARAGETAVPLGGDVYLLTGAPPAELLGLSGTITMKTDAPSLPRSATSLVATDGMITSIFVGPDGVQKLRMNTLTPLTIANAARPDPDVVVLPSGRVGVFCGDVVRIDPVAGTGELIASNAPRTGCAVAATDRYVVVAGGMDASGVVTTADIYDANTLALVAQAPLVVPRVGAEATALPNGQVLIAGGRDGSGAPIATLELFTPAN